MEDLLQSTIANKTVGEHEVSAEEVAEVRRRLARDFESAEMVLEAGDLGHSEEN